MTYNEFINNIIETRGQWDLTDDYIEKHHIVPKCLGGSNKKENIIYLTAQEHYEAHRLLYNENLNNSSIALAWHNFHIRKASVNTPEIVVASGEDYAKLMLEFRKTQAIRLKGHKPYGTKEQRIEAARKGGFANKGVKKSFRTKEHCVNLSKAVEGYHWFTDGVNDTRCLAENKPAGYEYGQSKARGRVPPNKNKKCFTNGNINIYSVEQPTGFRHGLTRKCGKIEVKCRQKKVLCVETNIVYKSISEAEEKLRIRNIGAVCRGLRKKAGGFHWSFI